MGLCDRLPEHVTLGEFEIAGEDRFQDSITLVKRGRRLAAIYLLGYVAEAVLKCAFYRLWGYQADTLIRLGGPKGTDDPRRIARKDLGIHKLPKGLHNPVLWAEMIVRVRERLDQPLNPALSKGLLAKAQQIGSNWKVSLRYNHERTTVSDFRNLWKDVVWMRTNADRFWR